MYTKVNRFCKATISAILALVLAVPVMAFAVDGFSLNGAYVGGGGGQTRIQESDGSGKTSGKAFLGYEFNKTFSLEAGYVDLGKHDISGGATVRARGPFIEVLAGFAASATIGPFVKAGVHRLKVAAQPPSADLPDQDFAPVWGAGLNFNIGKHVGLRFEWERFKTRRLDSDFVSANIVHYYR